ncbi:hypothetical protein [Streptomyces sp. NPDC001594]|uniref:hypothetical protein n=1 Tax=Streptomyces sp. NPDC001594 TaxID=3364590 RepID=UPI0036875C71
MHAAAHDELTTQCAFLDARLSDLLGMTSGTEVMPAVRALADSVRGLVRQADDARARGDRADYDAAAGCLHAVAGQWADHPDYRPPGAGGAGSRP